MGEAAEVLPQRMTFEEAARLDPDEAPGELDEGRFVPMPKSTWRHGKIASNVSFFLRLYAREHSGWSVASGDPGTKLRHDPDTLRGPDVAMVRAEREPQGRGAQGWLEGAPDIVVEILGDRQEVIDLLNKGVEYIKAGAKMVWVLEPDAQQLVVLTQSEWVRLLGRDDVIDGGEALPGFSCRVGDLFE